VRRDAIALAGVSAAVLVLPMRLGGVSPWMLLAWLPGFGAIRDPRRIVYLYELAAVVAIAFVVARSPRPLRWLVTALALVAIGIAPPRSVLAFKRPVADFDRWVATPISVDPSCRSFYVVPASPAFLARSDDPHALYGIDSLFVAFQRGLPTLNGYSVWSPPGWELWEVGGVGYRAHVEEWVAGHRLTGVCAYDADARTIRPEPRTADNR
jgi:hypothetical protein